MEEWKPIEDYDNYEISNLGNVRNKKRNKLLTPIINNKNYYQLNLCKNNKRKNFQLHRLIAIAFIPNPNNLPITDHIDKNSLNNSIDNLRWVSHSQNQYNKQKRKNTTSKFRGVFFKKENNKWCSTIYIEKKMIYIGFFDTEEEGAIAFNEAIKKYNLEDFIEPNVL